MILLAQYLSLTAMAAVIPLMAVINLAMRSWTGRLEDAEQHVATVDRLYLSTIGALSTAIEAKDGVTSSHIHRVQHYAMGLAKALGGLDEQTTKALQAAALLHDTGKLAVPERILNKPGKLTPAEFETMKLHVDVGADILSSIDFPYPVVPIVRAHHENWDGTGYPNGLKGVDIPIGARILSVVDCYDALTSDRPYRAAMTDTEALEIIRARRGTMYDPAVVDMFERVCRDIGPMTVKPQLQKAIQQITKAIAPVPVEPVVTVAAPINEGPESLRALANLARVVSGRPTTADLASLIWLHVRHIVPNASCAFFVNDPASDSVRVTFVAGDAASMLQGLEMKIGERLTGWVAENQQPMVNSEAKLDLGAEAALYRPQLLPGLAARRRRPARRRAVALRRGCVQRGTGTDVAIRNATSWADVSGPRSPQRRTCPGRCGEIFSSRGVEPLRRHRARLSVSISMAASSAIAPPRSSAPFTTGRLR